jgi:hypothetical protein
MANNFGFDPQAVADANQQDTRDTNAMLMFQKGLGGMAEADQQQKQLMLQQLKAQHDQLNKEKDDYAVIFGNKEYSPTSRLQAYNSMVAIDRALNPSSLMKPMDKWDQGAENLSKDIGAARQELVKGTIDRATYNKRVMFSVGAAMKEAQSQDEITSLEDVQKKAMEAVSGSTATVNAGGKTIQGTTNPLDNSVEPYQTPAGPAVSTNVPEATFNKEYAPGGPKEQELKIKQQNADTASALIGQKGEALDVSTAKTILDGLNSSDKAKSNLAVQQFFNSILPPEVAGLVIDQNKLANDATRKKLASYLGAKVGVQPEQPAAKPAADKKTPAGAKTQIPEGYVVMKDKAGKRSAVRKEKVSEMKTQGYTLE